jgi:hypothetical protein
MQLSLEHSIAAVIYSCIVIPLAIAYFVIPAWAHSFEHASTQATLSVPQAVQMSLSSTPVAAFNSPPITPTRPAVKPKVVKHARHPAHQYRCSGRRGA